ncbi:TnsA endonuclease N-terminal domain-containing protein [Clostridium malenominatum]|uniref:TnsA endonuclease N-terminal domain-containing protein n=1 Tax=Clostridium malenominatum TaxID=1539 RepID=A0ABN1IKY5_9CLOT
MAKRKRITNVDKLIKEGRGSGQGPEYKPWIKIQDVPSLGRSTRLKGIKTGRQHEFLSDMERNYFYFLEYSDLVFDIREQYPLLPLEETVLIAEELGISHPKHPQTGEYIVMTTDFLITKIQGKDMLEVARTIKSKEDLLQERILEKFEIEKRYWSNRDVDWGIVTDIEIDKDIAKNISYIHSYYDIRDVDSFKNIDSNDLKDLIFEYLRRIIDTKENIRKVSRIFDEDMALDKGSGISIFKCLLARKIIAVDLKKSLDVDNYMDIKIIKNELTMELNVL